MNERVNDGFLRVIIPALALADGVIHLLLDFVLFRGRLIGSPFPAGPRLALPLPLNEMFLLNFLGALVLVALFLYSSRWPAARRWLVDVVMIGYAALTFTAWWLFGRPNPMDLGYLSKGIEVLLVITLLAHISTLVSSRTLARRTA